jgi:hypothetical protein
MQIPKAIIAYGEHQQICGIGTRQQKQTNPTTTNFNKETK